MLQDAAGIIKDFRAGIIGLIVTWISDLDFKSPWTWLFVESVFLLNLAYIFLRLYRKQKKASANVSSEKFPYVGIERVSGPNSPPKLEELIGENLRYFMFLGVSAGTTSKIQFLEKHLKSLSKLQQSEYCVRFLLLDPNSDQLAKAALEEEKNESPRTWKGDIETQIGRLKDFAAAHNVRIEIRTYDQFPIWRMIIVDDKKVALNYYLPATRRNSSPTLFLEYDETGLIHAAKREFDRIWDSGKDV